MKLEHAERAERIAEKLSAGSLPKARSMRMWAGRGDGRCCDGCDQPVLASEIEYEHDLLEEGATVRFHAACSALWTRMTG
jgi:hypothetical protein